MDLDGINPRKAKEHPDAIPGSRPLPVSPARKLPKSIQTRHKPRRPPPSDKGTHGSEIVYSSVMAITFRNPHGPPMALAKKKKDWNCAAVTCRLFVSWSSRSCQSTALPGLETV
jgi:hypothetical protein